MLVTRGQEIAVILHMPRWCKACRLCEPWQAASADNLLPMKMFYADSTLFTNKIDLTWQASLAALLRCDPSGNQAPPTLVKISLITAYVMLHSCDVRIMTFPTGGIDASENHIGNAEIHSSDVSSEGPSWEVFLPTWLCGRALRRWGGSVVDTSEMMVQFNTEYV